MNERIRQLALEARLGPALLLHHWGKVDALTDSEQEALEQIEKFAQLIVRDCKDLLFESSENNRLPIAVDDMVHIIDTHFEVEE